MAYITGISSNSISHFFKKVLVISGYKREKNADFNLKPFMSKIGFDLYLTKIQILAFLS